MEARGVTFAPYYRRDRITIYNGDSREILPTLPSADLVLTDPPYGHGKRWSGGTWATNDIYAAAFKWDASTVPNDFLLSVIAAGKVAIVWGGNYYDLPPSRCWLAWEKRQKMRTLADFELAWTNMDRPAKLYECLRNPDGKREHPTQKPLGLMAWCIEQSRTDGTILDPFMGSGSTLVAARNLGRKAIGIEIDERYCEIAANRLEGLSGSRRLAA